MSLWFSAVRRALSWNPYFTERTARSTRTLKLPDLFAPLGEGASSEFEINRHCKKVTDASDEWFREQCQLNTASSSPSLPSSSSSTSGSEKDDDAQSEDCIDLKAGLLAAICFPAVDFGQLRLCADFLNWMLHFEYKLALVDTGAARKLVQESLQLAKDPSSSVREGIGRALKNILTRFQLKKDFFQRFSQTLQAYLHVLDRQLQDRQQHVVPDIESYIALQREGGWPRLLFLLLECSQGPSSSTNGWRKSRAVTQLTDAAADVLMYSTDILARTGCVKHLSQSSTHNTVTLLAKQIQQQNPPAPSSSSYPHLPPHLQAQLTQPGRPKRTSIATTTTFPSSPSASASPTQLDLQIILPLAVIQAGELYAARVREFLALKGSILSPPRKSLDFAIFGVGGMDSAATTTKKSKEEHAAAYARGLARCVSGVLYWSFESERYFGRQGQAVRIHRTVELAMIRS